MNQHFDEIKIHLPQKADYVGFVRLSVSGIASKMGFDIDTIEDIKVAVSEVCNRIISLKADSEACYDITFQIFDSVFKAIFTVNNHFNQNIFEGESGEFASAIISSLMDEFNIAYGEDYIISMEKDLGDCVNG